MKDGRPPPYMEGPPIKQKHNIEIKNNKKLWCSNKHMRGQPAQPNLPFPIYG